MNIVTWIMRALVMSCVVVVTACGGGGSGGSSENVAPIAFDLNIDSATSAGQAKFEVGDQLQARYEYYDADNDPEGDSQIRWYRDNVLIAGANSAIYFVENADAGSSLSFSVTPIALQGQSQGQAVRSSPKSVAEATTNPATPVSVAISGTQSVAIGANASLSATVQFSDGSSNSNVTWSSNNTGVLTITSSGQITGVNAGTAVVSASNGSVFQTHTVEVFESFAVATGVSITGPSSSNLIENQTTTLAAMVAYSDGSSRATSVNWSSNNVSVATVASNGVVTAVGAGMATITAEFDGLIATHQVTVETSSATVESISISGVSQVEAGQTSQYTATLHYSNGTSMQGAVQWSTNSSAVASINSSGLLTANGAGSVTITASFDGVPSDTLNVTVTETVDAVLQNVSINGPGSIVVGSSITLTATASYSDGSSELVTATWGTNNPHVVSLGSSSTSALEVTGSNAGSANVTASFGGMNASHPVNVTDASSLVSIEIFPKTLRTNTSDLQQAIAVGTDGDGHKMGLTHLVNWSSSDSSVVSVGQTGEVTIVNSNGAANITASYGGVEATYTVTELDVGPPPGFFIYFRKPDSWTNANFYVWVTDDVANKEPTGAWGGMPMDPAPELGASWYSIEVLESYLSSDGRVNFKFNDFGGTGAESGSDLYRNEVDGSQWWTDENTASDTPPDGVDFTSVAAVDLHAIGDVFIYTDSNPGTNLLDTSVAVGTVLNVDAGEAPLNSAFHSWIGNAALYVVDPSEDPARMVAVDVGSMTIQPEYTTIEEDLYKHGRDEYVAQCEACHGENGVGFASFPAVTLDALQSNYADIGALAAYIETDMSPTSPGACVGTEPGGCAYEIAAMIFAGAWIEPEGGSSCDVNSFDDMVPTDRNLRMLTKIQYINSVEDIFGITLDSNALDVVPPDSFAVNFDTASFIMPDSNRISSYDIVAGTVSEQIINTVGFSNLASSCNSNTSCIVENVGMKVFRRPLTSAEITRYSNLYSAEDSGQSVIHALLLSPYFLMRSELGEWDSNLGYYRLTNYEVAAMLSYTFWGTTPDATLLQAAASANFDVQAQVNRMLNDPRAVEAFALFTEGWLFDRSYPFSVIDSAQLQSDLREETLRFVSENVFNNQPFEELLTANYSYMNSNVANFYGERNVTGWERVEYTGDNATRSGVIGHASFLATHTSTGRTSPIKRGVYLRSALLCQEFPPPVAPVVEAEIPDNLSIEDLFRMHTEDEGCQSCHQFIDEPGFSFQNFGMDGLLRATELAVDGVTVHSVDGTGAINSLDSPETVMQAGENIPYNDMRELGQLLAESPNTSACYVRQFYRYTNGRKEERADECTINVMGQKFRNGQQNLRDLMIEMTTMPNYTLRK